MIQIDSNFRISTDSSLQNFQLEQLQNVVDRKSKEVVRQDWGIIGFHGNSMRSVLLQYKNAALISDDKLETLNNVLDKLKEVEQTIERVVKRENIKLETKQDD